MLLRRASAHAFTIPRTLIDSSRRSFHHNPETSVLDVLKQMELDNSRLLHITKKKIEQRVLAFRELHSQNTLSPEQIRKIRIIKELEPLQAAWDEYGATKRTILETTELLLDPDPIMRSLAENEQSNLLSKLVSDISRFTQLLTPKSPTRSHSALMELKAGVGGDEASLFVSDLLRMYGRFGEFRGWQVQVITKEDNEGGRGIKSAVLEINGEGSYDALKWESGVHRVQRVPETEKSGRVHTSTAAVVVLPMMEDNCSASSDSNRLYDLKDVKVDVMRARGAGGQHVNKTESAVRLTHLPTGITVSMQDERSQHRNRDKAFRVLSARLLDKKLEQEMLQRRSVRRALVRGADRSEKVRTYNWAQGRVTDHRINLSVNNLNDVLEGDGLGHFVDALAHDYKTQALEDFLESE